MADSYVQYLDKQLDKDKDMNKLDLTPSQLRYLRDAVDKMMHPWDRRRMRTDYDIITEAEKKDLAEQLDNLKPKPVKA